MLIRRRADNGVVYYCSPLLLAMGVCHAFSTRIGGVSPPPFDSLNLGNPPGEVRDSDENVKENLGRLEQAVGLGGRRRLWVHQVHGDRVAVAEGDAFECGIKADAMVSGDPRAYLLVRIADCVPVLLSSPGGRFVAAVHAGWRGVVAGVVPKAVEVICGAAKIDPAQVTAAIGPCIGRDRFEVGPEVVAAFVALLGVNSRWADGHVDLTEAVATQVRGAGLEMERVDRGDHCTARDGDAFFSHRRDRGVTGRMAAVIAAVNS